MCSVLPVTAQSNRQTLLAAQEGVLSERGFAPEDPEKVLVHQVVLIGAFIALAGALTAMTWLGLRLRVARRQAEAGSRAKSDFLANMSREIRTAFHLQLLVEQVAELPEPQAEARNLELIVDIPPDVLRQLKGDEARIRQIPQAGRADRSPARVLVADDNAANRQAAVRMIESLGLRADVSANGREALEMLGLLPYDLILMDCQMPFRDGQEATAEIRKREPPQRHTPIVAMTAETGADCLDDCLASGMDDILLKPVRREKLVATLHRWLPADREKHLSAGGGHNGSYPAVALLPCDGRVSAHED
jgi:CheY-like chemotaxis protein